MAAALLSVSLPCPSIPLPNSIIEEAENLTRTPNQSYLTLPRLLKSCTKSSNLSLGRQLHSLSFKLNLSSDLFVQTSLISLYSSLSRPDLALQVFDQIPHRNVVAWTAAINACLHSRRPSEALSLFIAMQHTGIPPDEFSIVSFLSACTDLGSLHLGRGAHALVEKTETQLSTFVGTSLVDMYCKCGSIDEGVQVFDSMSVECRSVQTWNAMLHGLAVNGLGFEAVSMFREMEANAVSPNEVTFLSLLCACAHSGLVEEGRFYFDIMSKRYNIEPNVKHYGCMVDLLGRAGLLDEAFDLVNSMHITANHVVWGTVLSACRTRNNVSLAEKVMGRIIDQGKPQIGDTSHYVMLSNLYRKLGETEKMASLRTMVGKKPRGKSWIEIGGAVHEFSVGGNVCLHPMWDEIERKLDEMKGMLGAMARVEEEWENPHSERLALALGLVQTRGSAVIRVSKNLRICGNCHDLMKRVSEAYGREIVVRDCNRFHRFIGGFCSCNDYW